MKIDGLKPQVKRRAGALHHGARSQGRLRFTRTAFIEGETTGLDEIRLRVSAARAAKAVRPFSCEQSGDAVSLRGKLLAESFERNIIHPIHTPITNTCSNLDFTKHSFVLQANLHILSIKSQILSEWDFGQKEFYGHWLSRYRRR